MESGGDLLSRAVTHQVPSALKGLTSVFGMGTGDPLRHCHRKLWRSLGSGAQVAFTCLAAFSLVPPCGFPPGLWTGAFPCPWSSPDSRGGARPSLAPPFGFTSLAFPPPSVLLRAGRFRLLSLGFRLLTHLCASAGHYLDNRTTSDETFRFSCLFLLVSACNQALGLLVSSSCTHCCASTDDLSPGSLPGALPSFRNGNLILEGGFTLRCLQRLSLPHFASLRCPWQDNSFTSGASTPVLSY